jgi:hypothetical protein
MQYTKEQQLQKKEKEKVRCGWEDCNYWKADNDPLFCKTHRKVFKDSGKSKLQKVDTKYKPWNNKKAKGSKRPTKESNPWQFAFNNTKDIYQRLRRAECADLQGMVICVSSGKRFFWDDGRKVHGGHFFSAGQFKPVVFDPMNVNPQAADSNMFMGNGTHESNYKEWIIKTYGQDQFDLLEFRAKDSDWQPWTIFELESMTKRFKLDLHKVVTKKRLDNKTDLPVLGKPEKKMLEKYILELENKD